MGTSVLSTSALSSYMERRRTEGQCDVFLGDCPLMWSETTLGACSPRILLSWGPAPMSYPCLLVLKNSDLCTGSHEKSLSDGDRAWAGGGAHFSTCPSSGYSSVHLKANLPQETGAEYLRAQMARLFAEVKRLVKSVRSHFKVIKIKVSLFGCLFGAGSCHRLQMSRSLSLVGRAFRQVVWRGQSLLCGFAASALYSTAFAEVSRELW